MSGPVLVDDDPGIDDVLALHSLVATGGLDLKAITAVAETVPLTRAVANARGLTALLSRKQLENLDDALALSGFTREILDLYLAVYEQRQ